jgi:ethanolamine-phosphate cytidylyltransferase
MLKFLALLVSKIVFFCQHGDRIVYTAGAFDLFHVGLLDYLEQARKEGDYLIVGLHSDPVS